MKNNLKKICKNAYIEWTIYSVITFLFSLYIIFGKWIGDINILKYIKNINEIINLGYKPTDYEKMYYYFLLIFLIVKVIIMIITIIKLIFNVIYIDKTYNKLVDKIKNNKLKYGWLKCSSGTIVGFIIYFYFLKIVNIEPLSPTLLSSELSLYINIVYKSIEIPFILVVMLIIDSILFILFRLEHKNLKKLIKDYI